MENNSIDLPLLKNNKPHISYSEVSEWHSCPWRHKLSYIDKVLNSEPSPHLNYGTILHDAVENFMNGNSIDVESASQKIRDAWTLHGFDSCEFIEKQTKRAESQGWKYRHSDVNVWINSAKNCLEQLGSFLDEKFPGWKPVAAEHELYEKIDTSQVGIYKGYIDCIIELPNGKHVIIDWKTSGPRGWNADKRNDFLVQAQLILYKNFWMRKSGKTSSQVKTIFILLKRESKPGKSLDFVEVSSGPKAVEKANKLVTSMIRGMQSGFVVKNKMSCKFCDFANTQYCT